MTCDDNDDDNAGTNRRLSHRTTSVEIGKGPDT